jgi:NAD(P)-dependent dehydrogenase (short-subunit alcohol dehydrogenase family)
MTSPSASKVVLITGATDGLGKAAAILLAEHGYRVYAAGRSAEKRAGLDRLAQTRNLPLKSLELDVTSDESVRTAVKNILSEAGQIDVLVNNAGLGYMAVVEELKLEDMRRQFETNVCGVLRVTQAVLPSMRSRRSGRILMISSVAGLVSPPTYGAYSSSKHALEGLSNSLRLELHPFNIEVVLIEPGYIVTNFQQTAAELAKPYVETSKNSPYAKIYSGAWSGANKGRGASKTTPEDCARVMLNAIETPSPKPRCSVTRLATLVKFGKRFLTDKMLDSILRRKYGVTRG